LAVFVFAPNKILSQLPEMNNYLLIGREFLSGFEGVTFAKIIDFTDSNPNSKWRG